MQERYIEFMEYLADALEECGDFKVVSQREENSESPNKTNPVDLPIFEVIADATDNEICLIRSASPGAKDRPPNFSALYAMLKSELDKHPDYSLRISEYFDIDSQHTGRLDLPIASAEVDDSDGVVRFFF